MIEIVDIVLLGIMLVSAWAVLQLRNLFAVIMLSGVYSLAAAALYVVLDAVDVAFTEASVGAGIATVLMIAALAALPREEKRTRWASPGNLAGLAAVLATGALLVYGSLDMPAYGDPNAPIHHHVVPRYIEKTPTEIGPPNVVTAVLAAYRGYDTLGETHVIFTAAIGVMVLIGRRARATRREKKQEARS